MPRTQRLTGPATIDRHVAVAVLSAAACCEAHSEDQSIVVVDAGGRALAQSGRRTRGALHIARLCLDTEEIGAELAPELSGLGKPTGPWAPAALPIRDEGRGLLGAIGVVSTTAAYNLRTAEVGQETATALLSGETA